MSPSFKPSSRISNFNRPWFMAQVPQLLWRVYNLHLHYYLSVKISFSFIIIVVFVTKLNRQGYSFPFSTINLILYLIYCIVTHFGKRFSLTIVNDYTRCTRLFLMNHKSKTQHLLESFITFAQNQFQTSIKTIRADNILEFISMHNLLSQKRYWMSMHLRLHSSTKWISKTQT